MLGVYKYINGNYVVYFDGFTLMKIALREGEEFVASFPDSIDLKISNRCSRGCPFCHENSVKNGDVLDLQKAKERLSQLPKVPIEIAMGGGNILESLEETNEITDFLLSRGYKLRCTIRYEDLENLNKDKVELLRRFEGIGISLSHLDGELREELERHSSYDFHSNKVESNVRDLIQGKIFGKKTIGDINYVFHIIGGLFPTEDLGLLLEKSNIPILVLGYKQWGRAKYTELPKSLQETEQVIKQVLYKTRIYRGSWRKSTRAVFDNLALEQLHIMDALTKEEWGKLYMGDEGTHSMYIDAVKGEYAINSRSPERVSWDNVGLIEYFKSLRK